MDWRKDVLNRDYVSCSCVDAAGLTWPDAGELARVVSCRSSVEAASYLMNRFVTHKVGVFRATMRLDILMSHIPDASRQPV